MGFMATIVCRIGVIHAIGRSSYLSVFSRMMIALQCRRRSATVFDSEFAENLVEMVLYRVSADPQNDCDFLVGFALTQPFRHFLLAGT